MTGRRIGGSTSGRLDELLEREREQRTLESAVAQAREGRGRVLVIEGPPGAGKSRLLAAAVALAEGSGVAALFARATELEHELPFGVARQLLGAPVLDHVVPPADADGGLAVVQRLAEALLDRVFGDSRGPDVTPHLLAVDDYQWADRSSALLVSLCALRAAEAPLTVVLAVRSGEPEARAMVDRVAGVAPIAILRPEPLSDAAVGTLVRRAGVDPSLVGACKRATGGNPFFVHELIRELRTLGGAATIDAVDAAAPEAVLRGVMARVGAVGPDGIGLARALAVLGDGARLAHAAQLAELAPPVVEQAADDLARAAILAPGEPLSFQHPLIGSTLRADMGAFARARAHRRAAGLLARDGAAPERVAAHLLHARAEGDPEVVRHLRAAAELSRSRAEPEVAVRLLTRALAEPPPEAARAEVLLELAEAEAIVGSPDTVVHLEQALEEVEDPRRRNEARAGLARTLHHAGEFARAAAIVDDARHATAPGDPLAERLLGTWVASAILHPPLYARLADELTPLSAAARAGRLPSDPTLCALLAMWLCTQDAPAEHVRALAEAAFARDPLVDGDARGAAMGFAGAALVAVDALEQAERLLDAAVGAAARQGAVIAHSIALLFRASAHHHRGRLAEAVTDAERSLEVHRFGWSPSPWSTPILALAHVERGDLPAAQDAIATGERAESDRAERAWLLEARSVLRRAQGRPEDALADARAAGGYSEGVYGTTSSRLHDWTRLGAQAAHAAGRPGEAQELADEALRRARAGGGARHVGSAMATAGVVAGGEAGLDLLTEAVALLEASPAVLAHAHAALELGAALRRAGRRSAAREPLLLALERADAFGALPLVERARRELDALGLRPRRSARTGIDALTPSELRVARLAARGLSTPQIAHELYVTRKTVESHLGHIYRKLEVGGRGELPEIPEDPAG